MKKISIFLLLTVTACQKENVIKSNSKSVLSFIIGTVSASIDETNRTVKATVSSPVDITSVTPVITVSDKASINPASGVHKTLLIL